MTTTQRTYGNWRRGNRPGLFGLGPAGTGVAFAVMVSATLAMTMSRLVAVAIVGVGALLLVPMALRWHGRTGAQILIGRLMWWHGKRRGQHVYLTGIASPVSQPHRLPGILASSQLWEVQTGLRGPLAVVVVPQSRHYSVSLRCQADGTDLVDQSVIDQRVGRMAMWLAALAREPMLEQAQITVETTPDHGTALASEILGQRAGDAPQLASKIMDGVVSDYASSAAQVHTWVTLTFKPPTAGKWTHESVCAEIATRIPALAHGLVGAGASAVTPMSTQDICAVVAAAYDPDDTLMDRSVAGWENCGPVAAEEGWDTYRHDCGVSRTWGMVEAPRGTVYATAFSRLTDPDPRVLRKRVSIIYRPYSQAAAAVLVERDRKDALFEANKKRQATARDTVDIVAAEQAAHDEATGAGIVRFSILATVTVRAAGELDDAEARLLASAGEARLTLRRMYRSQAAGFAANLPTGVVLPAHVSIPL